MKCALVTGGARGIGRVICKKLAVELGYHVLINYQRNEQAATETLATLNDEGATGEIIKFDVGNATEVNDALQTWSEHHPEAVMEVIVNNAGVTRDGLFMWMSREDWSSVLDVSLQGFYNVTHFFIQKLLHQRYGRIINIVSVSGVKGTAGQVNYSAAKAGVVGATKALAQEIAKRNITVNAVAPGFIRSDMTEGMDEKELKKIIPANRFGEAEEVADLVCFLASKKAGYITGEVININGGIYA
ncbi:3-oxoacyl-ACP reductase FabG [Sphingobacterium phlebotomi]|uniref:3-oxoacyl-ACP reductase FabG n=1 Tax=Sphingobacterium phlebotomi TaxID=2605433 RepID=A0A5D4HAE0_9SPHI|nr:3-oxoacyl-ACP reductase FabG [Sphingobacterium phlebotomi]TYR37766.1 3-oxoacyl-ACP reductase FabG [Sphingobacterium phlebotomi]